MKPPGRAEPLYLDEADLAARIGLPLNEWRGVAIVLERAGLPARDTLFGRRYWPAVKAYLDRRAGLTGDIAAAQPDGAENFDDRPKGRDRSRPRAA